jgi:hypothetical protein
LMYGIAKACGLAAEALAFDRVEVRPSLVGNGLRVLALNPDGRTLVSEIEAKPDGEIDLQTEVIGVTDGSCHVLLDRFDAEIERLGLTSDRRRESTGGVCQLATAREFVGRRLVRAPAEQRQRAARGRETRSKPARPVLNNGRSR